MTLAYGEPFYRQAHLGILRDPSKNGRQCFFALALILFAHASASSRAPEAWKPPAAPTPATGSRSSDAPDTPAVQGIPLPQIADRAKELNDRLLEIYQQLNSTQESLPSEGATQARAKDIRERAAFVDSLVKGLPTSLDLRDEDQYWVSLNRQFTSERKLLTSHATALENRLQFLEVQKSIWQATFDQIRQTRGIQGVVERVQQELHTIEATRTKLQDQLNLVLTLQNQTSQQDQQITEALNELRQAREQLRGHLFERDGHPLWQTRELRKLDRPMTLSVHGAVDRELKGTGDLLGSHKLRALLALALYGLTLFFVFRLKAYVRTRDEAELPVQSQTICSRPYSVAVAVALLGTIGRFQSTTSDVAILFALLWLIPTLRLLPPLIRPGTRSLFYAFLPVLLLEVSLLLLPFSPVLKRDVFVLNMLLSLVLLAWLTRPARLRRLGTEDRSSRLLDLRVQPGIVLLAVSLGSNFFAFLSLSQLLPLTLPFSFF